MSADIYIQYPFAVDSDALTPFTMNAAVDNSVSFQNGFTDPYDVNLQTMPPPPEGTAFPITRSNLNYVLYVLSLALQQYQQAGVPNWISPTDNGGTAFAYAVNAIVLYTDGNIYQNLEAANTVFPGVDDSWFLANPNIIGKQTGEILFWPNPGAPAGGYLQLLPGATASRTTYANLYNVMNQVQTGTLTGSSNQITGLSDTSDMYNGMSIEATNITPGTVITNVINSTTIDISTTALASDSESIRFFQYGNGDGSTTFTLPQASDRYIACAGGVGIPYGNSSYSVVGQRFGGSTYMIQKSDMANHTHDPLSPAVNFQTFDLSGPGNFSGGSNRSSAEPTTGNITGWSSQTSIPTVPPTMLWKFFVKY